MNERFHKVLTVMVLGTLLVASCSRPAEPPASPEAPAAQAVPEAPAAPAPVEVAESPKPEPPAPVKKAPAAKPVPAPVPVAPPVAAAPAPAPVPVPAAPAPVPVANAPAPVPVPVAPPAPPVPTTHDVSIPSGTLFAVRMVDSVDSKTDQVGQTYKASMDSPVIVDGQTIVPKGGEVFLKLTKVASAGNIKGASEVQLQLDRVYVANRSYVVTSNTYQSVGSSEGKKTVKQTGIGAGIGAVIGAIAGGGKGAAIGAGVGGGAGAATAAITKGEQVRIASEEKLDFRLEEPLNVTVPISRTSK